jgi:hypothetical protein
VREREGQDMREGGATLTISINPLIDKLLHTNRALLSCISANTSAGRVDEWMDHIPIIIIFAVVAILIVFFLFLLLRRLFSLSSGKNIRGSLQNSSTSGIDSNISRRSIRGCRCGCGIRTLSRINKRLRSFGLLRRCNYVSASITEGSLVT